MSPAAIEKVGADDFIASGHTEADLENLPREDLPHKEPAPRVERVGDEIAMHWPSYGVTLSFDQLRESSDGIHGEVSGVSGVLGEIHWGRLNLASTPAREGLVKKLDHVAGGPPWRVILERSCREAVRLLRAGEPAARLEPRLAEEHARYLVPRLILAGETNTIFADGGSAKSLLALAVAVAASTGVSLPYGIRVATPVPTLVLDWESTRDEHEDRLARLLEGFGIAEEPPIYYRPMSRALADDASAIRAEIARHRIGFITIDSLAPACGSEPDGSDSLIRAFNALRSFGAVSRLVIAHMSKAAVETKGQEAKPFGSVFVYNLSRNVWRLQRAEGDDGSNEMVIAAYHRKNNTGPLLTPFGLRFMFHPSATTLHAHDLGQAPELAARASLAFQIKATLTTGSKTAKDIADAIEAPEKSVGAKLRELKNKGKVIRLPDSGDGRGRWGLPA